jgi:TetR/AcrR family transcriptional regulator, ethionamide resistance regulator
MSTRSATARRRENARARREVARERIVAAAERLLLECPYRELTVDHVMAEAGLSRTVFYRHFDGLPDVLLTLLGRIEVELAARVAAPPGEDWPLEILAAAVDVFARHGPFLRALDHAAGHDVQIEEAYCAFVDRFVAETAALIGPGERAYELARALNLMNGHYLMETLGRDPGFDRELALQTLLTVWSGVARQ